ncbi:MAG: hypothetical protein JRK53_01975 [Deltaproteobacteria bacterium]|nr:hypothetical protein [Deltaproteobacteria bacterium]MBW1816290.1 hypothetical protein [Deltaproteobacteria bacterium]MBW2283736.1 hypothetical protein [Deltaproteobacteria bacterium]
MGKTGCLDAARFFSLHPKKPPPLMFEQTFSCSPTPVSILAMSLNILSPHIEAILPSFALQKQPFLAKVKICGESECSPQAARRTSRGETCLPG